jgi:hypothetical protein
MVPLAEEAELRLVHLAEPGTRAHLEQLRIIKLLVYIGSGLVEKNQIFKLRRTAILEANAPNKLVYRNIRYVTGAIHGQLQVSMA